MTPASAALLLPRRWRTVRLLALRTSALLCRHSCSSYSSHRGLQQMPLLITMWCPSAPTTGRTYQRGHRKDAAAPRRRRRRWPQLVWEHSRRGKRRRRLLRQLPLLQSAAAPSAAVMGSALPILRQQQRQQPPLRQQRQLKQQHAPVSTKSLEDSSMPLPGPLTPSSVLRPQIRAGRPALAATQSGHVAVLSGACIVEYHGDGYQNVRCNPRSRLLACCALSPCGSYLAAGEAGGTGRGPHVLVFDVQQGGTPVQIRGHRFGVKRIAWTCNSSSLLSVGEADPDHGGNHQISLWSWPQAEQLASARCVHGVLDVAVAPSSMSFLVVAATTAKHWSIVQAPENSICSGGFATQLVGRALPTDVLGLACEEDAFVAAAWGAESSVYLLTGQGILCMASDADGAPRISSWGNIGHCTHDLVWAPRLGNFIPEAGEGILMCVLEAGVVQIFEAETLTPLAQLANPSTTAPMVGIACSSGGGAVWVLHADQSLARWRQYDNPPDVVMPESIPGLRDAQCIFGRSDCELVTCTDKWLHAWATTPSNRIEIVSRTAPSPSRRGEITAMASSHRVVACGHSSGDIHLMTLPELSLLASMPARHSSGVSSLAYSPSQPTACNTLFLASASYDRSAMVFRIDIQLGAQGVEACQTTLLVQLQRHSAAVHDVALISTRQPSCTMLHLAVCTSDKALVLRGLELSGASTVGRRSQKQLARGSRWVGVSAHPLEPVFFAACSDRRVLKFDAGGQTQQQARIDAPEFEFVAPLRVCSSGRLLAICLSSGHMQGGACSALLLRAQGDMQPVARLAGHAEIVRGVTFLQSGRVLVCWPDGTMLTWSDIDPATSGAIVDATGSAGCAAGAHRLQVEALVSCSQSTMSTQQQSGRYSLASCCASSTIDDQNAEGCNDVMQFPLASAPPTMSTIVAMPIPGGLADLASEPTYRSVGTMLSAAPADALAELTPLEGAETLRESCRPLCCAPSSCRLSVLKRDSLPPKPLYPPPAEDEPDETRTGLSSDSINLSASPISSVSCISTPCRSSGKVAECSSRRVAELVAELRSREADAAVLSDLGQALLAESAALTARRVHHIAALASSSCMATAATPTCVDWLPLPPPLLQPADEASCSSSRCCPPPSLPGSQPLRGELAAACRAGPDELAHAVQRLCCDAAQTLGPGPHSAEVTAKLSRLGVLLPAQPQ
mmetsp:Transcript_2234/g.5538  ORF Transcript_2234/g.5538 Transcript_2234/m.5538 type:complete len:1188 (+) Transcript_2234:525-4088(+)